MQILTRAFPTSYEWTITTIKQQLQLRGNNVLTRRRVKSVTYGSETVSFLAPKIWDILPEDIKDSESLDIFKRKAKKWIPSKCPCRLCKTYVPQVGFI